MDVVVGSYRQKALTVVHTKEYIRIEAVAHHAAAALYGWVVRVDGAWRSSRTFRDATGRGVT